MRFTAHMTEEDERPLLAFVRAAGGLPVRIFSPVWPPAPLEAAPRTCGKDECLAIWYPDIITPAELLLPDCRPERGPHGCYDAWALPLVTFQRQWYWKKQATIFAVELDHRLFRANRPEAEEFPADEVADFEERLGVLRRRAGEVRDWCRSHLRLGCIGEGAWREADELRQFL